MEGPDSHLSILSFSQELVSMDLNESDVILQKISTVDLPRSLKDLLGMSYPDRHLAFAVQMHVVYAYLRFDNVKAVALYCLPVGEPSAVDAFYCEHLESLAWTLSEYRSARSPSLSKEDLMLLESAMAVIDTQRAHCSG